MNIAKIKLWREKHASMLEDAVDATKSRRLYSPYSDNLSSYNNTDIVRGEKQFKQLLGTRFDLYRRSPPFPHIKFMGGEVSPYGFPLGITYRSELFDDLLKKANFAMRKWERLSARTRASILCEAITRIHDSTFLFANIGMHTSGHSFFMGFHANAIHAQARALESVANIYRIEKDTPKGHLSEFSVDSCYSENIQRNFKSNPIGLSLIYSNQLVPTWGAYPAIFASLAAGCPVILIPHPNAILPIALTVKIIKSVCTEAGIPNEIINLFCSENEEDYQSAALNETVKIIDYMGKSNFGNWLQRHTLHARVMSQQSSYTSVYVDSCQNYEGMIENLAFGLCSYSAQLCTSPQNIYVLKSGIRVPNGVISCEQFQQDLVDKIDFLIKNTTKPRDLLGALANENIISNIKTYSNGKIGKVIRLSKKIKDIDFDAAHIATPLVIAIQKQSKDIRDHYAHEVCGPISFVIIKEELKDVIDELRYSAKRYGMLGIGLYTTDEKVERAFNHVSSEVGALLSINFCSNYFISQCSVFTDIHGSAINPSSNIIYGTSDFYNARLRLTETRKILLN